MSLTHDQIESMLMTISEQNRHIVRLLSEIAANTTSGEGGQHPPIEHAMPSYPIRARFPAGTDQSQARATLSSRLPVAPLRRSWAIEEDRVGVTLTYDSPINAARARMALVAQGADVLW